MYNVGCLLTNLDMCVTSQCMYATMPLVMTYMYDSAKNAFERATMYV